MRVVVRGRLSVYEVKGEYQIVCDALEPHGLGALQAAFEQLKRTLQAEGLFDAARKRPLPVLPRRIGIVTSLDGAALRDILRILIARHPIGAHRGAAGARAGRRRAARSRARARAIVSVPEHRRRDHRPRRRFGRGSVGVQRRSARARDRGLPGAGDLGGRPRSGFHDRRLRRRRARGHAVERRRTGRRSRRQVPRAHRSGDRAAARRAAIDVAERRANARRARSTRGCGTGRSRS